MNENAPPKVSEKSYTLIRQEFINPQNIDEKNLLIFENNHCTLYINDANLLFVKVKTTWKRIQKIGSLKRNCKK